jgi:hypothetical protein
MNVLDLLLKSGRGELTDEEAARWLRLVLQRHCDGVPLDRAIEIDSASLIRARNLALCEASDALTGAMVITPWERALQLERAVRRFRTRIWPRCRLDPALPLGPADAALHRAFRTGRQIPGTARRLFDLLK